MPAIKGALTILDQEVVQDNTCTLKGLLTGPDHTEASPQPIAGTNVSVATLTVLGPTGATIGTANRDVKSNFDAGGNFRYVLSETDNALVGQGVVQYEDHYVRLAATFTVAGETHKIKQLIRVRILKTPV